MFIAFTKDVYGAEELVIYKKRGWEHHACRDTDWRIYHYDRGKQQGLDRTNAGLYGHIELHLFFVFINHPLLGWAFYNPD